MELGKTMKSLLINVVNNKELILKDLERLPLEEASLGFVIQYYAYNGITSSLENFLSAEDMIRGLFEKLSENEEKWEELVRILTEDDK